MGQKSEAINWAEMEAPEARPFQPDFLEDYTMPSLLAELRRVAKVTGRESVRVQDLNRHARVDYGVIQKKFGTLHKALEAAGLKPMRRTKVTNEELLDLLRKLWMVTAKRHGRAPRAHDLKRYEFPCGFSTIVKRFGSWRGAILQSATWKVEKGAEPFEFEKPKQEPRMRENLSVRKRFLVFKRDGYQCRICGKPGGELEVDHIKPWAKGGGDGIRNLQTTCRNCNRGKRADLEERKKKRRGRSSSRILKRDEKGLRRRTVVSSAEEPLDPNRRPRYSGPRDDEKKSQ